MKYFEGSVEYKVVWGGSVPRTAEFLLSIQANGNFRIDSKNGFYYDILLQDFGEGMCRTIIHKEKVILLGEIHRQGGAAFEYSNEDALFENLEEMRKKKLDEDRKNQSFISKIKDFFFGQTKPNLPKIILGFPCFCLDLSSSDSSEDTLVQYFFSEKLRISSLSSFKGCQLFRAALPGYLPLREIYAVGNTATRELTAKRVEKKPIEEEFFDLEIYSDYRTLTVQEYEDEKKERAKRLIEEQARLAEEQAKDLARREELLKEIEEEDKKAEEKYNQLHQKILAIIRKQGIQIPPELEDPSINLIEDLEDFAYLNFSPETKSAIEKLLIDAFLDEILTNFRSYDLSEQKIAPVKKVILELMGESIHKIWTGEPFPDLPEQLSAQFGEDYFEEK